MSLLRSPTTRAMITSIRQDPDDLQRWLVFADWLTDQGDVRGELVALELQASDEALPEEARAARRRRISDIVAAHRSRWLSGLDLPEKARLRWHHGFVTWVWLPWGPDTLDALGQLIAHPTGALLAEISLKGTRIAPDGLTALSASGLLAGITALDLSENFVDDEGLAALAVPDALAGLRALNLRYNRLKRDGAAALASASLAALVSLDLDANQIGDDGLAALASSTTLANLAALHVQGNSIGDKGATALASSTTLAKLVSLNLRSNRIGDEGARAIATSAALRGLRELDLHYNHIGDEGARALAALPALTSLHLRNNNLSDACKAELSGAAALSSCRLYL